MSAVSGRAKANALLGHWRITRGDNAYVLLGSP